MITLHFSSNSRSQRVLWLLEELNINYQLNKIKFHPSELKSDEHRKRHPLGRVPVLEDNDVIIYESGAIIEYIIEKYDNRGLKPTKDDKLFPYYLQWYHYCEGMVMPPMNQIVVQTILLPLDRRDETVLKQAQSLLTKSLLPINKNLEDKEYLIGKFSGADVMLGHACFMANRLGCVGEELGAIKSYVERISTRPSFQKAIELK